MTGRRRSLHYVFRSTDSVERVVRTIAGVEKLRDRGLLSWDLERTITVDDPARPKKTKPEGIGLGGFGEPLGGSKSAATVRAGTSSVSGRLPPEVIQRIVRQNFGRFRLCYENGLRTDPKLAGRVTVKFVIDRSGAVEKVSDGGSTLSDQAVISCIVRAFGNLSFPQPEGGIVTVVYPIELAPAK